MSNRPRMKRHASPRRARVLRREQLASWLASLDPPAAGLSMIDGYLAALVVSHRFIPPEDWLKPILGERVTWVDEGTIEAAARNMLFQRYNEFGTTLSGGPRRYAPLFLRTDEGQVLIEDFADGFYVGMQLSQDD